LESVEGKRRHVVFQTEGAIKQVIAVAGQAGAGAHFLGNAFARFQDGVKVVLLEELHLAEAQDVRMYAATSQLGTQQVGTLSRFIESACPRREFRNAAVSAQGESNQSKVHVDQSPLLVKIVRTACPSARLHK